MCIFLMGIETKFPGVRTITLIPGEWAEIMPDELVIEILAFLSKGQRIRSLRIESKMRYLSRIQDVLFAYKLHVCAVRIKINPFSQDMLDSTNSDPEFNHW